ncbi:hypothetical protein AX15_006853 [Amanita polypyramis BW_CC]|nr:hypothetical protein AX15_006853 [Amanita polypyramis BW_CC]
MAMKVVRRTTSRDKMKMLRRSYQQYDNHNQPMSTTEHGIQKEIAIMKRCRHPNLVDLFEVIDDRRQEKIYIIMEYLSGGPIEWTNTEHEPVLLVDQARRIIRDVIVGLDYLHHQGIVHRDIKPANLLWTEDRSTVKIIDFGVSHFVPKLRKQVEDGRKTADDVNGDAALFPEGDLHKRVGTPSFLAPEVVWFDDPLQMEDNGTALDNIFSSSQETVNCVPRKKPAITKAIDVWSLAVTFYCFLFGHTPFSVPPSDNENVHHNEYALYHQICTQDWSVDEAMGADLIKTGGRHPKERGSEGFTVINLLDRMLQKDPRRRVTLEELKCHPWFLRDVADPEEWLRVTSPLPLATKETSLLCRWARRIGRKLFGGMTGSRRLISPSIL